MRLGTARILSLLALAGATAADAYDPIVTAQGWYRVADYDAGECYGEVGTNGKFYVIGAFGLGPNAPLHLTITNGDMVPIERDLTAAGDGSWTDYYIPFRWADMDGNAIDGGTVTATISTAQCTIPLTFDWSNESA